MTFIQNMQERKVQKRIRQDSEKMKTLTAQASDPASSSFLKQWHGDYLIGQTVCHGCILIAELVDLSEVGEGVWIQVRNTASHAVFREKTAWKNTPSNDYINGLIHAFEEYRKEDTLAPQLLLRPFGKDYVYQII